MQIYSGETEYLASRYDAATMLLPYRLRERARLLPKYERAKAEELRFRVGNPISVLNSDGEHFIGADIVTAADINGILDVATQASAHSVRDSMRYGYITVRGGFRIGICGTAVSENGTVSGFRTVSSLSLRIAKQMSGIAAEVMDDITEDGELVSTLIVSPPGFGKTTLLRDIIKTVSNGDPVRRIKCLRVGVSDERGEIAGMYDGTPQMNVGCRTDILDGCPKSEAVMMLLRTMNPQVIALDEITEERDIDAIAGAVNCGVRLLATAHGASISDLMERKLYSRLCACRAFKKVVVIKRRGGNRVYVTEDFPKRI